MKRIKVPYLPEKILIPKARSDEPIQKLIMVRAKLGGLAVKSVRTDLIKRKFVAPLV